MKKVMSAILAISMLFALAVLPVEAAGDLVLYEDDTYKITATKLKDGYIPANWLASSESGQSHGGYIVVLRKEDYRSTMMNVETQEFAPIFEETWRVASGALYSEGIIQAVNVETKLVQYIDLNGNIIPHYSVEAKHEGEPGDYHEGVAVIAGYSASVGSIFNKGYGIMDRAGNELLPISQFYIGDFSDGVAFAVQKSGEPGRYIDKYGFQAIPGSFTNGKEFHEGYAAVANSEGEWGFINRKGELVIPYQYAEVGDFSEGLAWVVTKEEEQKIIHGTSTSHYINTQGEVVLTTKGMGSTFYKGVAETEAGFITKEGKILIPGNKKLHCGIKLETGVGGGVCCANGFREGYAVEKDEIFGDYYILKLTLKHSANDAPAPDAPAPVEDVSIVGNFTDVPTTAYYADAVAWAIEKGITNGTSATTFSPDLPCTHAQIATFLWRMYGSPEATWTMFPIVSQDSPYYKALVWAGANDLIITGLEDVCNRCTAVEWMWQLEGRPKSNIHTSFNDINTDAVAWAVEKGITTGTSATTFSPAWGCTRGQIVTFLYRYYGQ